MSRRAMVLVLAAVLALAGTGALAVAAAGTTLERGAATGPFEGLAPNANGQGWTAVPGAREFVISQMVQNTGRLPLTVTGVVSSADYWFHVEAEHAPVEPGVYGLPPGTRGRALPVEVPAGGEIYLFVRYRQQRCWTLAEGASATFGRVQVNYRVLGVQRTASVPYISPLLADSVAVKRHPGCA